MPKIYLDGELFRPFDGNWKYKPYRTQHFICKTEYLEKNNIARGGNVIYVKIPGTDTYEYRGIYHGRDINKNTGKTNVSLFTCGEPKDE